MDVEEMLQNAGTASQNRALLDDPVTRGAILRSIAKWLEFQFGDVHPSSLIEELEKHADFKR